MISFSCQSCDQTYTVADDKAGRRTTCAKCRASLTVPLAAEDEWVEVVDEEELIEVVDDEQPPPPPAVKPRPRRPLVPCKECGANVSRKAVACPQCGVSRPGVATGTLELIRASGFTGAMYAVQVSVDGEFLGELRNGGILTLDLPAGERLVELSGGGLSREAEVTIHDGETTRYQLYFSAWGALGGGLNFKPA